MKNLHRAVVASLITFALSGCFEENIIETVKGLTFSTIDPTLTLGNALDTRKMCKEVKWWLATDDRKREVVNYSCDLSGVTDYFTQWNDDAINKYLADNEGRLKQVKLDAENAKKDAALRQKYFSFVERLDKQNVIAALARVKKNTPAITVMSRFAFEPDDDRAEKIGIPAEVMDSFTIGSKFYTKELSKKEYGADFSVTYFNTFMMRDFEELIDGLNAGKTILELIEAQKEAANIADADAAEAEGKAETLEYQFTKEGIAYRRQTLEANQPIKVVQHLVFAPTETTPVLLSCEFDFYTPNSKEKVAYKKVVSNGSTCLVETYKSEYDKFYNDMFKTIYLEQKGL